MIGLWQTYQVEALVITFTWWINRLSWQYTMWPQMRDIIWKETKIVAFQNFQCIVYNYVLDEIQTKIKHKSGKCNFIHHSTWAKTLLLLQSSYLKSSFKPRCCVWWNVIMVHSKAGHIYDDKCWCWCWHDILHLTMKPCSLLNREIVHINTY